MATGTPESSWTGYSPVRDPAVVRTLLAQGRARAPPGGAWPRPGRDRVASSLGQTRAGSRSPGPGPAPSACSLTVRPAPAQDDAGSAGAREVAARPRPSRRAATAARAGFGGRPDLAGRFAEVALIVPMRFPRSRSPRRDLMRVEMLGHACLLCETEDTRILMIAWAEGTSELSQLVALPRGH